MRFFGIYVAFLCSFVVYSQEDALAKHYFEKGQFQNAIVAYQELYKKNNNNLNYFNNLIQSFQATEQFDKAENLILERQKKINQPSLFVELGYNYQLAGNQQKADENYKKAFEWVEDLPVHASGVAYAFEQKNLLEKALEIYNYASQKDNKLNYDYQKGNLYARLGNIEMMVECFLDYVYKNQNYTPSIQNQFARFILDDSSESFTEMLRITLLKRVQKTQDIYWNEFLSWFFVQQRQYDRAFVQEKAIYRRFPESFSTIFNLSEMVIQEKQYDLAKEILQFILDNTDDFETHLLTQTYLIKIETETTPEKDYAKINTKFEKLINEFGKNVFTFDLRLLQARFIGFKLDKPGLAIQILNELLDLNISDLHKAIVKMELADMLLYQEKYNQALIYYSQIETELKNHEIANQASLKIAKTSYYKGDFDWALKQLSVLKNSYSQLIANDALDLYLLIKDTASDSTYTALKKFAKADFMAYKNKNEQAISVFNQILQEHKGEEIEAVTLLRVGQILEKQNRYSEALQHYQTIIEHFSEGIYMDEAVYFSAEIYNKKLQNIEKAKELYEKIIFDHQDSIYFVNARKEYRILRGDNV